MKGKHKIEVRSKRIVFTIELERNITILRGDSATGKTTLVEMLSAYACVDTAQTCRSRFHGVSQREEYADDIRATCKPKIQIWKESVLGERILRKYSRWK